MAALSLHQSETALNQTLFHPNLTLLKKYWSSFNLSHLQTSKRSKLTIMNLKMKKTNLRTSQVTHKLIMAIQMLRLS